jgi:UDP-hydrolysing UDP-N-acetyl-D-glucosamine 2-epimerase
MVDQIRDQGFVVDHEVPTLRGKYTHIAMAKTAGTGVNELANLFAQIEPDIVVTVADRYETLATAIAAAYLNIPLAHTQGGERTGSIDDKVRNAITELADIHFPATKNAYNRVVGMRGPKNVYLTGCPSIDLCERIVVDEVVRPNPYVVVMLHPDTREPTAVGRHIMENIVHAIEDAHIPADILSPNVDAAGSGIKDVLYRVGNLHPLIRLLPPQKPLPFLEHVAQAGCLIGNSSMGIRECSYLGVPAINIGNRQEGRERGPNVFDLDTDATAAQIRDTIKLLNKTGHYPRSTLYGHGDAGRRIAEGIAACV